MGRVRSTQLVVSRGNLGKPDEGRGGFPKPLFNKHCGFQWEVTSFITILTRFIFRGLPRESADNTRSGCHVHMLLSNLLNRSGVRKQCTQIILPALLM